MARRFSMGKRNSLPRVLGKIVGEQLKSRGGE
jgi:hypothetical protein